MAKINEARKKKIPKSTLVVYTRVLEVLDKDGTVTVWCKLPAITFAKATSTTFHFIVHDRRLGETNCHSLETDALEEGQVSIRRVIHNAKVVRSTMSLECAAHALPSHYSLTLHFLKSYMHVLCSLRALTSLLVPPGL